MPRMGLLFREKPPHSVPSVVRASPGSCGGVDLRGESLISARSDGTVRKARTTTMANPKDLLTYSYLKNHKPTQSTFHELLQSIESLSVGFGHLVDHTITPITVSDRLVVSCRLGMEQQV